MTRAAALLALHAAVALFGFAALFGKWLTLPPEAIVLGRTVVAATTLALALALQRASSRQAHDKQAIVAPAIQHEGPGPPPPVRQHPSHKTATRAAINGALLAIHWVAFFAAVQVSTVAIALLGFASFPVFVLALECVERKRLPSALQGVTVLLVAIGLAVLVPSFEGSSDTVRGLAWGIVSGLTFALLAVRNRGAVEAQGAITLALWQNAFAALWLVPWIALQAPLPVPMARDLVLVLVLGVACTALAHTLFIASMRRVSAHTASVVSVLEPVYGIVLAAVLLGERPEARTLAGMVLIVAAALLATRQATR